MRLYSCLDMKYLDETFKAKQFIFDSIEAEWVDQRNGKIRYDSQDWPPTWIIALKPTSKWMPADKLEILNYGMSWFELEIEYVDNEADADGSIHKDENFFRSDIQTDGWVKIVSRNQTDKVGY